VKEFRERRTITYKQSIMEPFPPDSGFKGLRTVGRRTMECVVEVILDVDTAAAAMGSNACRSKGGSCRDGVTQVKRIGTPKEIGREMTP
jgi:hypothetical protein